jgi:poly(3-hydroxybutyrate) depolymerase
MLPASDPAGPTIDVEVTVEVAGRQRFAVACVPGGPAPAAGWPVVIAFHGGKPP